MTNEPDATDEPDAELPPELVERIQRQIDSGVRVPRPRRDR